MIEIVTFRLAEGAEETAFLVADARAQIEFTYQQRGIVRRTTARGPDGEWLVVTLWDSEEDAEEAGTAFAGHPATADLRRIIDRGSVVTRRYSTLD